MEFKKLNTTKVKAILSKRECEENRINPYSEWWSREDMKPFVKKLLTLAKEKLDFNKTDDRVLIQIFPREDDGADIFLTAFLGIPEKEKIAICENEKLATYKKSDAFFMIKDRETLLRAFQNLKGKNIDCDLYKSDTGAYFIAISDLRSDSNNDIELLCEYGEKIKSIPESIKGERGKLLSKATAIDFITEKYNIKTP